MHDDAFISSGQHFMLIWPKKLCMSWQYWVEAVEFLSSLLFPGVFLVIKKGLASSSSLVGTGTFIL
jgi:hypothetical protein